MIQIVHCLGDFFSSFAPLMSLQLEPSMKLKNVCNRLVVSSAAAFRDVTERFSPTNGCLNPNPIYFPLFRVHVKITECSNHALPIVSSETNHVSLDCR